MPPFRQYRKYVCVCRDDAERPGWPLRRIKWPSTGRGGILVQSLKAAVTGLASSRASMSKDVAETFARVLV